MNQKFVKLLSFKIILFLFFALLSTVSFGYEKLALVYVGPSSSDAESILGHTFLIFYDQEKPTLEDPTFSYLANTKGFQKNLNYLKKGLAGGFATELVQEPFFQKVFSYTFTQNRILVFYEFSLEPIKVNEFYNSLTQDKHLLNPYYFIQNNCSHGIDFSLANLDLKTKFSNSLILTPSKLAFKYEPYIRKTYILEPLATSSSNRTFNSIETEKAQQHLNTFYSKQISEVDLFTVNNSRTESTPLKFETVGTQFSFDQKFVLKFDSEKNEYPLEIGLIHKEFFDSAYYDKNVSELKILGYKSRSIENDDTEFIIYDMKSFFNFNSFNRSLSSQKGIKITDNTFVFNYGLGVAKDLHDFILLHSGVDLVYKNKLSTNLNLSFFTNFEFPFFANFNFEMNLIQRKTNHSLKLYYRLNEKNLIFYQYLLGDDLDRHQIATVMRF